MDSELKTAPRYRRFITKYFPYLLTYQLSMLILLFITLHFTSTTEEQPILSKRWGGFEVNPTTNRCYRQERTATILAVYLGWLGADQFYAHHWVLAVFKSLTFGGTLVWAAADVLMWIVGGVYGTPGCPGSYGGI